MFELHTVYFWLFIALFFLFVEIFSPGLFFFAAFAAGSLVAAGASFFLYDFSLQCFIALISSLLTFFFIRRRFAGSDSRSNITNIFALRGSEAIVTKIIQKNLRGEVQIGRERWPAVDPQGETIPVGTRVVVIKILGNTVIIKKL